MLILSVYSTLVPIVTLTGYGTLGYSCALMSELKIRKVKKMWEMARTLSMKESLPF